MVTRLWSWGDSTNFNKTKPKRFQLPQVFCILIKACTQTNRVFEMEAKKMSGKRGGMIECFFKQVPDRTDGAKELESIH